MPPFTDAELLARSESDPPAFAELYRRHERAAVAFVGRMVRDPELTVDVVAETFARVYEARDGFRGDEPGGSARAWILGIARHVVFAAWRAGRVESDARQRLGMQVVAVADETLRSVEQVVLDSEHAVVEAWLADLPPEQREAIRRRVLEDGDYEEIARDLRCSPAVVRQRVSRGLGTLRRTLMEDPR
jgi:RNA polymerase sigma factor (sigma-70 family)